MRPFATLNRILILAGLVVITALWSTGAALKVYSGFNLQVSLLFQSASNDILRTVLYWLAYINGDWRAAIVVIIICLLVWWRRGWYDAVLAAAAGFLSETNIGLKAAFQLPRPSPELVQVMAAETGFAYPSGHSFFSIMFYGFLAYLALRNIKGADKWALFTGCIAMILVVGISRIFLGVHWFSDVIGGYLFGGFFLSALIWAYEAMENKYRKAVVNR